MISVCREHASNVKRWRHARMALRWCAAGWSSRKQFRRVNATCTYPHSEQRSNANSPTCPPRCTIRERAYSAATRYGHPDPAGDRESRPRGGILAGALTLRLASAEAIGGKKLPPTCLADRLLRADVGSVDDSSAES